MAANLLRAALLAGVAASAAMASSIVAWKFGHAAELGRPWLGGWLYDPTAAWRWWQAWGHAPPYRAPFLGGLSLTALLAVAPVAVLRLVDMHRPLQVQDRDKDAGLGTPRDLRRSGHVKRRGAGVVLGKAGRLGPILRDDGDGHVLIMGPARSGKGVGHVVPTLLSYDGSVIAIDPKRELHAIAGRHRRTLGPVVKIDPTDPASARLNPILELRPGLHLEGDCQMMAAMLAYPGHPGGSGKDETWDAAAADLVTTLLHHVRLSDEPTLAHLGRLLQDVRRNRYPKRADPYVLRNLDAHRRLHEKVRDSVNFTLRTRLAFLDDPLIQRATSASDFRPGDLQAGDEPMTLFLSVPSDQRLRLRPFTRLMLQALWAPLTHDLGRVADGRPKRRPVLALIDEFPQLGRMDVIEHGIADCAGYGLRVALVCQDIDQINAAYGNNQSITANCSTICAIPGFSGHGLDVMAKWAGEHIVAHASKQIGFGRGVSASSSQSETRAAVLNARDMLTRSTNEVLVFVHGSPPTWLRKIRYFRERAFQGMFDPPTMPEIPSQAASSDVQAGGTPPWLQAI